MSMTDRILLLGIGNILMGDEGIGIHAIRELEKRSLPQNIDILDGGTAGFDLMGWLDGRSTVILIDATMNDKAAGNIELLRPRFSKDFPNSLSAHDIGLRDLIEGMHLLGKAPELYLFAITIKEIVPMTIELSNPIKAILPELCQQILSLCEELA
jgi:hydrogenase maturation protease